MSAVAELKELAAVEERARMSAGASERAIYEAVALALRERRAGGDLLADVGCGGGGLWPHLCERFAHCVGVDVVRYEELPGEIEFRRADLNTGRVPLPGGPVLPTVVQDWSRRATHRTSTAGSARCAVPLRGRFAPLRAG